MAIGARTCMGGTPTPTNMVINVIGFSFFFFQFSSFSRLALSMRMPAVGSTASVLCLFP